MRNRVRLQWLWEAIANPVPIMVQQAIPVPLIHYQRQRICWCTYVYQFTPLIPTNKGTGFPNDTIQRSRSPFLVRCLLIIDITNIFKWYFLIPPGHLIWILTSKEEFFRCICCHHMHTLLTPSCFYTDMTDALAIIQPGKHRITTKTLVRIYQFGCLWSVVNC